jgi:hypothetical protein
MLHTCHAAFADGCCVKRSYGICILGMFCIQCPWRAAHCAALHHVCLSMSVLRLSAML